MARVAVDFTKVNNKNYQLARIMQVSDYWSKIYRDKVRNYAKFRSSILFPEMILGLNQKTIFGCYSESNNQIISIRVISVPVSAFQLRIDHHLYDFRDLAQVDLLESDDSNKLVAYTFGTGVDFTKMALFSNKKDAVKFLNNELESLVTAHF